MKDWNIPCVSQESLGEKGCFYVGGSYYGHEGKHHMSGQMFVEVYKPKKCLHPYPIIMFHGAGQTNMNWLMTPDGRMGWADYFVSRGYCVFLAEQPARGRSAYHPEEHGDRIYHPLEAIQNRFTTAEGGWPQASKHTQWPGSGADWGDETFRQFAASQVEYLPDNRKSQELVLAAGAELLRRTGPAILLTHSQGGPFGWLLADYCPELVKAVVAAEPFGPPFSNDVTRPCARNYGLAELPLHYVPAVERPEALELELQRGGSSERKDGWVLKEPAPQLPNLMNKAILLLVSEASYHAGYDHLMSHVLKQCGVEHDFVRLEDVGIHGNGHMMMLEKNNLEIAGWIASWLDEHIKEL